MFVSFEHAECHVEQMDERPTNRLSVTAQYSLSAWPIESVDASLVYIGEVC